MNLLCFEKMDEIRISLERHDQQLKTLMRDVADLRAVQSEIRSMNETLVTLATELKNTNEHLSRHERKLEEIENQPKHNFQHIIASIISAVAGCIVSLLFVGVSFK